MDLDADAMFEKAYTELRSLARSRLGRTGRDAILDTTSLVHESYLRLARNGAARFPDLPRFLVYASRIMRSVIVDLIRQRQSERGGGEFQHVPITTRLGDSISAGEDEILKVHEALDALEALDERMARVVEMRYFAGMTEVEIAQALCVTDRTVRRDWQQGKLFLAEALG